MFVSPFVLLLLYLARAHGLCPDVWTQFGGSCYYLFEDPENWVTANQACQLHKSHLVTIESTQELNFVRYYVQNKQVGDAEVWIGASDTVREGTFFWESSRHPVTVTDWGPGEPSRNYGGDKEDCVEINRFIGYKWNDRACFHRNYYLCETSPNNIIVG